MDNAGDQVIENPNEGYDTVFGSISYALPANAEEVVLTGTGNLNAVANTLDDTLVGNDGDNQFTVGPGTDIIIGGGGTDTVVFSGHRADYAISEDNTDTLSFTVTDLRSGSPNGVSIVSGVEFFGFTDGTVDTASFNSPTVNNPDGTHTVTTYDTGNIYPWSSTVSTYDTAGHLAAQTYNEDNGGTWTSAYDTNSAFNWAWSTSNYDGSGKLISQTTTYDDGTHSLAVHDAASVNTWSDFTVAFDANWNVVSESGSHHDATPLAAPEISAALDSVSWYTHPADPVHDFLLP